jgi:siroheme synthase-like protein
MADSEAAYLYPIALDLRGRRCVIVGGGTVATRKAEGFLPTGATVVIVAPEISEPLAALIAEGRLEHHAAPFSPDHLMNAFLAVAATNNPDVNRAVGEAARAHGALLNAAAPGDDEAGDFATMATVRRGDMLIAITTGGAGPALSARVKRELDAQFGPEWAPYIGLLRTMRDEAKAFIADDAQRVAALRRLAGHAPVLTALQRGDTDTARREALSCLS